MEQTAHNNVAKVLEDQARVKQVNPTTRMLNGIEMSSLS